MIDIDVSGHQQVTLIEVKGRVDSLNAAELGEVLFMQVRDGNSRLVLDLSGVDYMSSAGLREIVTGFKNAKKASGDLRLAQPSDRVREVLEMAGLDTIFKIFSTQAEAVNSF